MSWRLTALALAAILVAPATAEDARTQTFAASLERVFAAVEAALRAEGWGVDHADRPLGLIISKSRRLAGDDDGIHAKTRRLRLRIQLTPAGHDVTAVAIERELFDRERLLWMEKDTPVALRDPAAPAGSGLEQRVFTAIGNGL